MNDRRKKNEHKKNRGLHERKARTLPDTPMSNTSSDTGQGAVFEAEEAEQQQYDMLDSASLEQAYQVSLSNYVEEKQAQGEHIEERLERMILRQQDRIQQANNSKPGFLSLPNTKRDWSVQHNAQLQRLNTLQSRLEHVHEIQEGMGLHSSRIEDLATRKMRAENPELASSWQAMREQNRKQEIKQGLKTGREARSQSNNLSRSMGIE